MKRFSFCLFVLAVIAMAECLDNQEILQNGNNKFTARMFTEVVEKNKDKSVVLSAFSVLTPLAQLALASEGPSHDEILNAIGFPDDKTTNEIFSLINEKDSSIQGIELKKASKLYIPLGYQVQDEFAAVSRSVYRTEIANVNFGDPENTAKEINTWVEEQTNHRIKDLVAPNAIGPDTRGLLCNALYFKGIWKHRFVGLATRSEKFYVTKTNTMRIPTMHNNEEYAYGESDRLKSKLLNMAYVGDQSSLLLVLPNDIEGIGELLEKLKDPNILDEETKGMFNTEVDVSIPKFKIETTTNLREVLEKMNVTKLFTGAANLNKLLKTDENLYISDAVQKAFIVVNEEGAEAAAANYFGISATSAFIGGPRFVFTADHPFAFFLKVRGDTLFNGIFYGS
ncbi:antichymotrypsin-2-like [Epargyreus clarus]|uniref:antichymotrypsin-2-like n=1 Tax=Epargyreus clarus TaxID=520877 RepID=UPI003C300911